MWLQATSTAHDGTAPAGAMVTPFAMPCGHNILNAQHQMDSHMQNKCAPPGFAEYWWSSVGYYSPAICPSGYAPGCSRWHSKQGPPLEATETAIMCVPEGYQCVTKHISMAYSYSATAPMIQVRWAETDLSKFATHPLYPGANPTRLELRGEAQVTAEVGKIARQLGVGSGSASGFLPADTYTYEYTASDSYPPFATYPSYTDGSDVGSFPTSPSSGSPGSTSQFDPPDRGLSVGAIIGVAVAAVIVFFLVDGIIVFFIVKKIQQRRRARVGGNFQGSPFPGQQQQGGISGFSPNDGAGMGGGSTATPTVVGTESTGGPTPVPAVYMPKDSEKHYTSSPAPVSGIRSELDDSSQPQNGGYPSYHEMDSHSRAMPQNELSSENVQRAEMGNTTMQTRSEVPATPITRKGVPTSVPASGPDHRVSILPGGNYGENRV